VPAFWTLDFYRYNISAKKQPVAFFTPYISKHKTRYFFCSPGGGGGGAVSTDSQNLGTV